jgi:hypothetical protein
MGMERTRRAVLVGSDTARLLALADELEGRGLEVALYRDAERGIEACDSGQCDVLVAIGRLAPRDGVPPQRVSVPLVLLDAPDAPDLPLRPIGPRTALGASVAPAAAADRVLALLARASDTTAVAPSPAAPQTAPPPAPSATGEGSEVSHPRDRDGGTVGSPQDWGAGGGGALAEASPPTERLPSASQRFAPPERAARAAPEPTSADPEEATASGPPWWEQPAAEPPAETAAPVAAPRDPADRVSSLRRTMVEAEEAQRLEAGPAQAAPLSRSGPRGWFSPPNILATLAGFALGLALGFLFLGLR